MYCLVPEKPLRLFIPLIFSGGKNAEKMDTQDFQNRALKFDKTGETEINLSEMNEHVTMD